MRTWRRGSISKPRERGLRRSQACLHLDLKLASSTTVRINFCVSHPICGTHYSSPCKWMRYQTETGRLLSGAQRWLSHLWLQFLTGNFFWESQRIVRIQYSGASWKKTQKGEERLPPALLLKSFIFSDSDILATKGNRSHVCGYWGVWTITVQPRLIMTLGTLRRPNLSPVTRVSIPPGRSMDAVLGTVPGRHQWCTDVSPLACSCRHSTGGAENKPSASLRGHLVSRGYIFGTWGWISVDPFSDRTF